MKAAEEGALECWRLLLDKKVNIEDLWFMDLRRTAVVRLAEAGCSVPEIAAINGH